MLSIASSCLLSLHGDGVAATVLLLPSQRLLSSSFATARVVFWGSIGPLHSASRLSSRCWSAFWSRVGAWTIRSALLGMPGLCQLGLSLS